ncbi:glycosyltransferase family 4 protein [Deinococcus peraridilitoris]|uniref:Glycosyltransferase n=1 Tax=Deinococcus peraridilitoris (strain DSM 19664 / LMG 22246 / CIP 109416 / KR-200) TaxID=937777 RepID=L0A6K1_DEIPD|nr:glycosyltransferase family 4 protein [Deinococcus peraridilitoris]AFZ69513.1 glycosyltransferase [Deinococcus peraridilitoris DSM 19664]
MRIGVAGPVTLSLLTPYLEGAEALSDGYAFAPMARWVLGLRERGHQVAVFTLSPDVTKPRSYYGDGLSLHVAPYRLKGRARDFFAVERKELTLLMRSHPQDVLHAHWTYEFALAALASSRRVLVTAHDAPLQVLQHHPDLYRLARAAMSAVVAQKAPLMTAVSPYIAKHFARTTGRYDLHVVPNGIPTEAFTHTASIDWVRTDLTFASSMMGWGKRKNGANLLHAFSELHSQLPHTRLIMFGEGYGPGQEAYQYARAKDLVGGVEFAGKTPYDQMLARLSAEADIFVHPSLEESFGMALAEAMALGLPVIAGERSGAVPWVTDQGRAALLIDVSNVASLRNAMLNLAHHPAVRQQLSTYGREWARSRFTIEAQLTGYEQLYAEVLRRVL